jgi:4-amino-4-deoxy-L-arabinose transferase-like glycosyltransferase
MTAQTRAPSRGWAIHVVCCGALAAALWIQASGIRRATSATFDETIYLELAIDVLREGRFDGLIGHGVAPLPVLLAHAAPASSVSGDVPEVAAFAGLIDQARSGATLWFGIPLVLLVYGWTARRRGILAGLLAGSLLVTSPTVVAHGSLATTDACFALASLIALAALAAFDARRSPTRWLVVGVALGLALASKYTATFLFPIAALALLGPVASTTGGSGRWLRALATEVAPSLVGWGCTALLVAWALHGFAVTPLFSTVHAPLDYERVFGTGAFADALLELGRGLPVPGPLKGLQRQSVHMLHGQPAFLDGEISMRGWWHYFPCALAMKSTPVELALGGVVAAGVLLRRGDGAFRLWWQSIAVLLLLAIQSPLNTGVRYVLLLYPLAILCAVDTLADWVRDHGRRSRSFATVAALLIATQATSAAWIAPHHLAYFNSLVGGPEGGHLHLLDSNLDWGQDLPALRETVADRGIREVRLAYFGTAPIAAYGVNAIAWTSPGAPAEGSWLAVSANSLHGLYLDGDPFAWLRGLEPDARAGYSLFLYDLARPEIRSGLERARNSQSPAARVTAARTHSTG